MENLRSLSVFISLLLSFTTLSFSISQYDTPQIFSPRHVAPGGLAFPYPWPVQFFVFISQHQSISMAYMDVAPANRSVPKDTITLLHGKNFCGATWEQSARVLSNNGYRVIIPDQVGFCKSSKLKQYQFSLRQLALNINSLLSSLNISSSIILGHSMGGMISTRYALNFPTQTSRLVLVDPLGLEDWQAIGVPYQAIDITFQTELSTTFESIKAYQQATYYAGNWSSAYDVWVNMLMEVYNGTQGRTFAFDMALVTDMVFIEPIIYQISSLRMKSLLIVGDKDNTAIGKAWAPADIQPLLGHYEVLGKQVAAEVPNCTLIEFADLGHAPQIQNPDAFHVALLGWLG